MRSRFSYLVGLFLFVVSFLSKRVHVNDQMDDYKLNYEKKLIEDLFDNYQVKFGRPVNNMTERVDVYFGIYLIQLIDLDERNQVLITNVKSTYEWRDNGLKWDKSKYGNVDDIRLPIDKIWTPDIVLYNYADTRLEEKREVLAIVSHNGTVTWRPPSIFKSTCSINIAKFPYDLQNCSMKFGSWTYGGDSIDIKFYEGLAEINTKEYIPSNEWEIVSTKGVRTEKKYECCKEYFPDITFYLIIKRRSGFYSYILVLPCVLLSCLTTVLFWLPPESPAKMVLGMNIFTSFFVLLLLLSKNVPSASDQMPLIGSYYSLNMIMIATSTCSCTAVVHIFFRGQGQVPTIIRKIFLEFLARIFCMVTPPVLPPVPERKSIKSQQPATIITSVNNPTNQTNGNLLHHINRAPMYPTMPNRLTQQQLNSVSCTALNASEEMAQLLNSSLQNQPLNQSGMLNNSQQMASIAYKPDNYELSNHLNQSNYQIQQPYQTYPSSSQARSNSYHRHSSQYQQPPTPQLQMQQQQKAIQPHGHTHQLSNELNLSFNLIENDIKEIRDYLRHTRKKLENTDTKTKQTNEWKQVALVLDRTLFFIYIIAIIVSVIIMFPR